MSTQSQRRAEAETRLLNAAADLIAEAGPSKLSLASIGERAGYSRGLATHHFGSKPAMMQRLVERVTEQFRDAVFEGSPGRSALDDLLALIETYFRVISDLQPINRARLVLWADAVATDSSDVRPAMIAADKVFRNEVFKGLERGIAVSDISPDVRAAGLATVIAATLRGVALESMLHDDIDLPACKAEIVQLLMTRLTPHRDVAQPGL